MSGKMWSGRFTGESSVLLENFNGSVMFDKALYAQDIRGSIAHAKMLAKVGILTDDEAVMIEKGLLQVKDEIERGEFVWSIKDEDIHMAVEKRLTAIIGEVGKKLHTARSRNDQVAVDFRLYVQDKTQEIKDQLVSLVDVLSSIAKQHTTTIMPGMTHLQHAQPVNFGYHLMAYATMFIRDVERIQTSFQRNNFSPLGAAALAGTPHPIDREMTAKLLGFDGVTLNAMDSVSDRDFALDLAYNCSVLMMHASRMAEELVIWSSYEFKWVSLSDSFSTGSSIMPQKKNPDVPELIRGKTGRVYGNLMGLLTVMKGLSLAYNKDMQEDKEGIFDTVTTVQMCVEILTAMLETTTINVDTMKKACLVGHLTATDLADYLVKKGVPFRETHHISGRAVALAESLGCDVSELNLEQLQSIDERIEEDMIALLQPLSSMNARNSQGGTSETQTLLQIASVDKWIKTQK
jgi:argininosuccinate lyase